jgi:transposase-like protein
MIEENIKCPKCNTKPKYIGGINEKLKFRCPACGHEFDIIDDGFGYLPMREMHRHELYP